MKATGNIQDQPLVFVGRLVEKKHKKGAIGDDFEVKLVMSNSQKISAARINDFTTAMQMPESR